MFKLIAVLLCAILAGCPRNAPAKDPNFKSGIELIVQNSLPTEYGGYSSNYPDITDILFCGYLSASSQQAKQCVRLDGILPFGQTGYFYVDSGTAQKLHAFSGNVGAEFKDNLQYTDSSYGCPSNTGNLPVSTNFAVGQTFKIVLTARNVYSYSCLITKQ